MRSIEIYQHEYGVKDTNNALGDRADGGRDRFAQHRARGAPRRLESQQQLDRSMQQSRDIGRDTGMSMGL